MQLGITILLQKHLKTKKPEYGLPEDLFFCWEVHNILYYGKSTLVAVNANNRFFVCQWDMQLNDWKEWPLRMETAIERGLESQGYSRLQIDHYFNLAGTSIITKTHGRKPVAGLNKAIDHLNRLSSEETVTDLYLIEHCRKVNQGNYSPTGYDRIGRPVDFLKEDMRRIGIN